MCIVGETWAIFCVGKKEIADKKSPFQTNVVELGRGDMRINVDLYSSGLMMEERKVLDDDYIQVQVQELEMKFDRKLKSFDSLMSAPLLLSSEVISCRSLESLV